MILLIVASSLVAWNLAGYPALLWLQARREVCFEPAHDFTLTKVSVVVAAHNEAGSIGGRVENILLVGSTHDLEIIIVSDGSTDGTATRAANAAHGAGHSGNVVAHAENVLVRVIEQSPRQGKIAALHRGIAAASGDVIVITDANTRFEPCAIDRLVAPLSDARVGIAAGDLVYENSNRGRHSGAGTQGPAPCRLPVAGCRLPVADSTASVAGESAYWNYETGIKRNASRAGLLLMGAGGIYAFRKEDWPQNLSTDLADDSYVPLSLHRAGRRNIFVEDARACENAGLLMREEWRRRVRMVAQDYRVAESLAFGLPNRRTFFALISQKVIRWFLFPLMLVILVSARRTGVCRAGLPIFGAVMTVGAAATAARKKIPLVSTFFYLTGAAAAATLGALFGIAGRSRAMWEIAASTRK